MSKRLPLVVAKQPTNTSSNESGSSKFNRVAQNRASRAALTLVAAGLIIENLPSLTGAHNKVQEDKVKVQGHVTALDPILIDCRARMEADVTAVVPTSIDTRLGTIPGSGFTFELRNGKAEANSAAKTRTLTCIPNPNIAITYPDSKHEVVKINQSEISLFTQYVENESTVYSDPKMLSVAGEALGGALKFLTGGHVTTYMPYDQGLKAEGESFTRQAGIDVVEGKCAADAWILTKQVVEAAYQQQANAKHIAPGAVKVEWTGSEPSFTPPYDLSMQDGKFRAHVDKFAVNNCQIDSDVIKQVQADAHIVQPVGKDQ